MVLGSHHMVVILFIFFLLFLLIMFVMSLCLYLSYYPLVVSPVPLIVLFLLSKVFFFYTRLESGTNNWHWLWVQFRISLFWNVYWWLLKMYFVILIKNRFELFFKLQSFYNAIKNQFVVSIRILCSDNAR